MYSNPHLYKNDMTVFVAPFFFMYFSQRSLLKYTLLDAGVLSYETKCAILVAVFKNILKLNK